MIFGILYFIRSNTNKLLCNLNEYISFNSSLQTIRFRRMARKAVKGRKGLRPSHHIVHLFICSIPKHCKCGEMSWSNKLLGYIFLTFWEIVWISYEKWLKNTYLKNLYQPTQTPAQKQCEYCRKWEKSDLFYNLYIRSQLWPLITLKLKYI